MAINPLNNHYAMENPASVYDEEAMTALELAGRTTAKVNEVVAAQNALETRTQKKLDEQDDSLVQMKYQTIPQEVAAEVQQRIKSGEFDDEINTYLGGLNERVDNLLGLVHSGSTSGDAELIDIRTSTDGQTYTNAGQAVRAQVDELRKYSEQPNLIDLKNLAFGYIKQDGGVTGSHMPYFEMHTVDYIPVDPLKWYHFSLNPTGALTGDPWVSFTMYNGSKTLLNRVVFNTENAKVRFTEHNANTAYIRVSWRSHMCARPKLIEGAFKSIADTESRTHLTESDFCMSGFITADGAFTPPNYETFPSVPGFHQKERLSNFLPVEPGQTYVVYNVSHGFLWAGICFYNTEGRFVSPRITNTNAVFTVTAPANAAYMCATARTYDMDCFGVFNVNDKSSLHQYYKRVSGEIGGSLFVKSIAHRGYSGVAPENTLHAYRMAKYAGFDYAECDVLFTSDNVAVLLHDSTVDRTSDGTGAISGLSWETVSTLDFGSWFGETFTKTRIPSFEQFIALCRNIGLKPYIEVKGSLNNSQLGQLCDIVKQHNMTKQATWISFTASNLEYIKNVFPEARLGVTCDNVTSANINNAKALQTGKNEVFINSGSWTDAEVNLCMDAGLPLEVWTVDSVETIETLPSYISGVTSNTERAGNVLYKKYMGG